MFFYYHPESNSLWKQAIPLAEDETDGLVEEITYDEYRELKLKQKEHTKMPNFQPYFDATNIPPEQGGGKHPVGSKFPAIVTSTGIKSTKDNTGGYFFVQFTTQAGQISANYNIWNDSPQAVEIAQKQLSALLHAIGIFKIHCTLPDGSPDMQNAGAEIRNQRVQIDVNYQKGQEPTPEKPAGGYVEVSRVYDANGNEPGKAPAPPPQMQQPTPPTQQGQPQSGGWNAPASNGLGQAPATAVQQGNPPPVPWGATAPNNAPAPAAAPANAGWTQGPSAPAGGAPDWARR
jgi:hypothetical protein